MSNEFGLRHGGRLLVILVVILFALTLLLGPVADAQADLDCSDFDTQEEAQDELERDPSDPHGLDADNDGQACEDFDYGGTGGTTTQQTADLDCADFSTRGQAQAELAKDRSDPHRLDADNDGQACEEFDYGETTAADATLEDMGDSAGEAREGSFVCESFLHVVRDENGALRRQYRDGGDELVVQRFEQCLEADVLRDTIPNKLLPETGGASLPVGGGALLLVTGAALALRMIRR